MKPEIDMNALFKKFLTECEAEKGIVLMIDKKGNMLAIGREISSNDLNRFTIELLSDAIRQHNKYPPNKLGGITAVARAVWVRRWA